jgi:hypothetical protein
MEYKGVIKGLREVSGELILVDPPRIPGPVF